MNFPVIVMLSMGIFLSYSSGSPVCKCAELVATAAPTKAAADAIVSYKRRVKDGDEEFEEKIIIDENKETETAHVDAHGESYEADIINDFKRKLAMYRVPDKKFCVLGPLDSKAAKSPSELIKELENEMKNPKSKPAATTTTMWHPVSLLEDRTILSDEMATLCAKYPIYNIKQDLTKDAVTRELAPLRKKRGIRCIRVCVRRGHFGICIEWGCW